MNKFVKVFIKEAEELIGKMNFDLVALEKKPTDGKLISNIFRYAHTVKGGAASEGFENINQLAHKMEDILGMTRDKKLDITSDMIDLLLESSERIELILKAIPEEKDSQVDIQDLIQKLEKYNNNTISKTTDPQKKIAFHLDDNQKNKILKLLNKGEKVFEVTIEFLDSEAMKGLRGILVLRELKEYGHILFCNPEENSLMSWQVENDVLQIWVNIDNSEKNIKEIANVGALKNIYVKKIQENHLRISRYSEKEKTTSKQSEKSISKETMHIRISLLDDLLNNVGGLLICRTQIENSMMELLSKTKDNPILNKLDYSITQLKKIAKEIETISLNARLVPISVVFDRFPKIVRDLSKKLNKEVDFIIKGKYSELDKGLVDRLSEPLIHLIRNSLDHGIEYPEIRKKLGKTKKGTIILSAKKEGHFIVIEIEDDGKGIDVNAIKKKAIEKGLITRSIANSFSDMEAYNLLFVAGFSTKDNISDVSGRGVGMDVIKNMLDVMKGVINIDTQLNIGCRISMKFPLTLAIISSMLVKCLGRIIAIPANSIKKIIKIKEKDISGFDHHPVIRLNNDVIPLFNLSFLLWNNFPNKNKNPHEEKNVIIIGHSRNQIALYVDTLIGQEDIVVKAFESDIVKVEGITGATILGTGEIPLILDIMGIMNIAIKKRDHIRQGMKIS